MTADETQRHIDQVLGLIGDATRRQEGVHEKARAYFEAVELLHKHTKFMLFRIEFQEKFAEKQ